jgi:hypothetical protein
MLTIDLKRLGKRAGPALRYLTAHLDEPGRVKGSKVQLTSTNHKAVKLLLQKFLHDNGLDNYRVISSSPGLVEILTPKIEKKHPPPEDIVNVNARNETIPYYQASAEFGGVVPKPPYRRRWKP